ncbi:MAG: transporter substrate-binding domain-containing protein [SAR324 cluster bacterium]|nr:transporter substrate-binding domain-containing protein [SAR324 cluster bacterium]
MRIQFGSLLLSIFLLVSVLGIFPHPCISQELKKHNTPLRIAIDENYPPLTVIGPDGRPHGLLVKLWNLWGEVSDTPVEFIPYDWVGTLNALKEGEVDLHSGLFINDERSQWMDFSRPMHKIRTAVYFNSDRSDTPPLSSMAGQRVGVVKGYLQEGFLRENYPSIDLRSFGNGKDTFVALLKGNIDALVNEVPSVEAEMARFGLRGAVKRSPESFLSNTLHAGVRKSETELLRKINAGFAAIPKKKLMALDELWLTNPVDRFYKKADSKVVLTEKQKDWLQAHPVIRFAVTNFIAPVDIVDNKGNYSGLNADLINLINKKVGTNIVPEFYGKWSEVVANALAGKVDGVLSFSRTPEREKHILYTQPYVYDPIIIVARKTNETISSAKDISGKTISVVKGMAFIESIKKEVGDGLISVFESDLEALKAVIHGIVDAHVTSQFMYMDAQKEEFIAGLKIASSQRSEGGSLRVGIHKNNPILFSIIQTALDSFSLDELSVLRNKWLTLKEEPQHKKISFTETESKWLSDNPMWKVANENDWPPFDFAINGKPAGYSIDIIKLVAQNVGAELEFINGYTWAELMNQFKAEDLDILPAVMKTEERHKFISFTQGYGSDPSVLVVHTDTFDIQKIANLESKTVAVIEGYATAKILEQRHPEIKRLLVKNVADGLQSISAGSVDAFIGNLGAISYAMDQTRIPNIKIIGDAGLKKPEEIELHIGVAKDREIFRSILQKGLNAITVGERQTLRKRWLGSTKEGTQLVNLTQEEQHWLTTHKNFTLGVDPAWAPFEYFDDKGKYSGIGSGYVELITSRLGIKLTPQPNLTWAQVIEKAKVGEIDILPTVARTPEREKYLLFSEPYISFPMVIATRKDAAFVDSLAGLEGKKVGVVQGYASHELLETNHSGIQLVPIENLRDGLQSLSDGKISAFVDNLVTITHEIDGSRLDNIKIASPTKYKFELSMAVRKDLPELVPIINKTLKTISERERAAIVNSWTAIRVSLGVDMKTILIYGLPTGTVVVMIIAFVLIWNRRLDKEISERKKFFSELQSVQKTLNIALEASNTGIWHLNFKTNEAFLSDQWFRQLGYEPDDFESNNTAFEELLHPDDKEHVFQSMDLYEQGSVDAYTHEFRLKSKDGDWKWILSKGRVVEKDEHGKAVFITGAHIDLTERKKAEEEQSRILENLSAIMESIDYGILFMDSNFRALICNKAFQEMWGIPPEFLKTRPTMEEFIRYNRYNGFYNVDDKDFDEFVRQRVAAVESATIPPTEMLRADGRTFIYQSIMLQKGGAMLTYFDISEQKEAEIALQKNRTELQKALESEKLAFEELKTTKVELAESEAVAAMTKVFEKFVPKKFLNRIAKTGIENIELGKAESDTITILFSDIRSFTNMSEKMTPQELLNFLNQYLKRMNVPIQEHRGFIDKFIGDAIMALFDNPDLTDEMEASDAVQTAIAMQQALEKYNADRFNTGYDPISIGIGVHTGYVIIGTVGSEDRMDSTVLGDNVNVASRIEGLTKLYGVDILISDSTFNHLENPDTFQIRELDWVRVKGKTEPVGIYEVFDNVPADIQDLKRKSSHFIIEALAQRKQKKWENVFASLESALSIFPEDKAAQALILHCQKLQTMELPEIWDGAFDLDHK